MFTRMGKVDEHHFPHPRTGGESSRLSGAQMSLHPTEVAVVETGLAQQQIRAAGQIDQPFVPAGVCGIDNRGSFTFDPHGVTESGMVRFPEGHGKGADPKRVSGTDVNRQRILMVGEGRADISRGSVQRQGIAPQSQIHLDFCGVLETAQVGNMVGVVVGNQGCIQLDEVYELGQVREHG